LNASGLLTSLAGVAVAFLSSSILSVTSLLLPLLLVVLLPLLLLPLLLPLVLCCGSSGTALAHVG
jgi:hypothetical protein